MLAKGTRKKAMNPIRKGLTKIIPWIFHMVLNDNFFLLFFIYFPSFIR